MIGNVGVELFKPSKCHSIGWTNDDDDDDDDYTYYQTTLSHYSDVVSFE